MGLLVYAERKASGEILVHLVVPEGEEHDVPDEYLKAVRHGRNLSFLAANQQEIDGKVKESLPMPEVAPEAPVAAPAAAKPKARGAKKGAVQN